MTTKAKELQEQLEPGCGQVVEEATGKIQFPIALTTGHRKWLVVNETTEIEIGKWNSDPIGLTYLKSGVACETSVMDLIAELETIISRAKAEMTHRTLCEVAGKLDK